MVTRQTMKKVSSCQQKPTAISSPTMQELSFRFRKIAEYCCQMVAVSICSSPQQLPSKKPKTLSTKNSPNKKQKASFTEQISEVRLFDKDIRKSDEVSKHDNGRRGEKTRTVSVLVRGNFETLGSKFRNETEGLLPSPPPKTIIKKEEKEKL